jgi:hypothetical protein
LEESRIFLLLHLTSGKIWQSPLVHACQSTYCTNLKEKENHWNP